MTTTVTRRTSPVPMVMPTPEIKVTDPLTHEQSAHSSDYASPWEFRKPDQAHGMSRAPCAPLRCYSAMCCPQCPGNPAEIRSAQNLDVINIRPGYL
jgi:hypothetical protein